MRDTPFDFHGTRMTIRATTADAGAYAVIAMDHPPDVGPALHVHPRGAETFHVLDGTYVFTRGDETMHATVGDVVVIPTGTPHRYVSGAGGGRLLVITPPDLEHYFWETTQALRAGQWTLDEEFGIAHRHGQDFLEQGGHWGGPTGA
jgi:quercetin dioxygenase-like cupin family protein